MTGDSPVLRALIVDDQAVVRLGFTTLLDSQADMRVVGSAGDGKEAVRLAGELRPDVVWFGEIPYELDRIFAALEDADLFVSIGTSGAVYPAAGFVQSARYHGAQTIELNLEPSGGSHYFPASRMGPASQLVPTWVDEVLS